MLAPFLFVHEHIGKPEQFFKRWLANRRHVSDADAEGETEARGSERIDVIYPLLQTLADLQGGVMHRIGHQNAKFVPANPCKNIGLAKRGAENVCRPDQGAVTLQMPVVVINRLQIVKIHIHEQSRSLALNQAQLLLRQRQKSAAIVQTGQIVDQRKTLQRPLQTMTLNGVTQRARECCAVKTLLRYEILRTLLKRFHSQRLAFGLRQDHRRNAWHGGGSRLNDRAPSLLVRPNIKEQDVGALSAETFSGRLDAMNMCDAKLGGALGFEQIT